MTELEDEMDAMAKALEDPEPGIEDPKDDPPVDDPPTDPPVDDDPPVDPPPDDPPVIDDPPAADDDDPPVDPPVEEDPRDIELRELREKIVGLETPAPEPEPKPEPDPEPPAEEPIPQEDFLGETDLDELTRDPKLFNALLNKLYAKARVDARGDVKLGNESVVKAIPDIVKNNIALTATLKKVNEDFYAENKDLVPWKAAVATVFEEFISKDPGKSYNELLPDVAKEVRTRLSLRKEAIDSTKPPKLPRKKSGKRQPTKPDVSQLQSDMDEMDKALGLD